MIIYTLHAHIENHLFTETFSSMQKLEQYLINHPEISKDEVTMSELDPL